MFILYEIWWYGLLNWIIFIAIAFCASRFLGCFDMLLSVFVVAVTLLLLDVNWIFDDMRDHPENGRDADMIFMLGVALRVVVFNLLLLPVSLFGLRLFRRRRTVKLEGAAA